MKKTSSSGKETINGRSFTHAEIVEAGEKKIEKGRKARKVWGIILIVFGAMALIGSPIAKVQGSITDIGQMIGAMAGSIVIAGLGVLLLFKSKSYPSKKDPYQVGGDYLAKHTIHPSKNVVSRKLVKRGNVYHDGALYSTRTYEITYEDGHTERDVEETRETK